MLTTPCSTTASAYVVSIYRPEAELILVQRDGLKRTAPGERARNCRFALQPIATPKGSHDAAAPNNRTCLTVRFDFLDVKKSLGLKVRHGNSRASRWTYWCVFCRSLACFLNHSIAFHAEATGSESADRSAPGNNRRSDEEHEPAP